MATSERYDEKRPEITVDRALEKAVDWLDLAGQYEVITVAPMADRAMMVTACADVADTWVKIANLQRTLDVDRSLDATE